MGHSKQKIGLGQSLMKNKKTYHQYYKDGLVAEEKQNMNSITEQSDLQEFMNVAILSGRDFDSKLDLSIVSGAPSAVQHVATNQETITIPKRPKWDSSTTKEELLLMENESFLAWRRQLAFMEEEQGVILTPYEKNIEVWKQLWRVLEKSLLVVQIVDARHPLFFYSQDVKEYSEKLGCKHLLLVNKADLLSSKQRRDWAEYFDSNGIAFEFFSAHMAQELLDEEEQGGNLNTNTMDKDILSAQELLQKLSVYCPPASINEAGIAPKRSIGFVGYPNVGKSSTLNALIGSTKVRVSATPGKTKHFQTIHITLPFDSNGEAISTTDESSVKPEDVVLIDCPGLVFPNFGYSKAEMVLCGVLPLDQLRDYRQPVSLLLSRIPKWYLESIYGLSLITKDKEGNREDRQCTDEEFLTVYALNRGFRKPQGGADEARSARLVLKDYVNGKVLYVHPPPHLENKDQNPVTRNIWSWGVYEDEEWIKRMVKKLKVRDQTTSTAPTPKSNKAELNAFDRAFFENTNVGFSMTSLNPFVGTNTATRGDKKHKKEKRTKKRLNWSAE